MEFIFKSMWPRPNWRELILLSLMVFSGCEPAIPRVDPEVAPFRGKPPDRILELKLGREAYIAKCSGCHVLYRPSRGGPAYWRHWMLNMAEQIHLDRKDQEQILNYLFITCSERLK